MTATVDGATPPRLARLVAVVFLPFAGGYFLSYLLRAVNAVIAPDLVRALDLHASDLGFLTAAYFLSFALMQLPLGIALDRWGPRRVQTALLLIAAIGIAVFAMGQSTVDLFVGRMLIGIGFSGGLMASFKAIVLWFPQARWPLVNGCFMAMGGLGALTATTPVELALGYTDWRGVFWVLSALSLAAAAVIFAVVPERPGSAAAGRLADQVSDLRRILSDRYFWRVTPLAVMALGTGMAIQTLWAGPWLRDVGGLDRGDAARHLFLLALAMTVGFAFSGAVTDALTRRGVPLIRVMVGAALLFFAAQLVVVLQVAPPNLAAWLAFGVISNATVVIFPILNQHYPRALAGRVNAAANLLNFAVAFAVQFAIGAILDLWPAADGHYPAVAYQVAFGLMLALQVVAFLWFLKPVRTAP